MEGYSKYLERNRGNVNIHYHSFLNVLQKCLYRGIQVDGYLSYPFIFGDLLNITQPWSLALTEFAFINGKSPFLLSSLSLFFFIFLSLRVFFGLFGFFLSSFACGKVCVGDVFHHHTYKYC